MPSSLNAGEGLVLGFGASGVEALGCLLGLHGKPRA